MYFRSSRQHPRQTVLIIAPDKKRADMYYASIARAHRKPGPDRIDVQNIRDAVQHLESRGVDVVVFQGKSYTTQDALVLFRHLLESRAQARKKR